MKSILKQLSVLMLIIVVAATVAGCASPAPAPSSQAPSSSAPAGSQSEVPQGVKEHPEIKYRRLPTATSDLFDGGIAPILEKLGYKLVPVEITDSVQREIALSEDAIDMHIDAHTAYINSFNQQQGTELASVLAVPTVPTGIYPGTKSDLKDVAKGDKIAFPNDPSNEARSLNLLQQIGFVKMKEGVEPTKYTLADVVENPYELELIVMSGGSIAAVRTDFAYIILRGSDAYNSGTDFNTALAGETANDIIYDNRMQLVINGKNKDAAWVQDVIAAYKSPEFKEYMKTQGAIWILPDYMN